jgi:long-chain acyl-CoA synthetase
VTGTPGPADKPALIAGERTLSFGELDERAGRVHAALMARVGAGAPIAVMLPNSIEFIEVSLGAARAGCPVVPVNWHLKAEELAWVVGDSDAALLVAHASFEETARACLARLPACALVLVGGESPDSGDTGGNAGSPNGAESYEQVLASTAPLDGEWLPPSYLYFTSGTTGRPRAVERDGGPQASMLGPLAAMWGITGDDIYLACSPLYHAANGYAFTTLFQGGTVVIMERWDAREWLRSVERHRISVCFMVPAYFIRLLEVPSADWATRDLSSLRLVLHAAAPCPVPVKWQMLEALPATEIWEFYGATEGGATRISPADWRTHPGSVGTPWPGVEIVVLDDDGRAVPPGQTGTIYIRPPGASRFRYHNDPDKTARAWSDDAFSVGDVGHLDGDGFLYITDRSADLVLRGGVNVYPAEVEAVLHRHPDVVDCAVLGVPDTRLGEELLAIVETRSPLTADELRAYCREHLADYKCPRHVEFVDRLPRDPTGKVLKRQLRAQHREADRT